MVRSASRSRFKLWHCCESAASSCCCCWSASPLLPGMAPGPCRWMVGGQYAVGGRAVDAYWCLGTCRPQPAPECSRAAYLVPPPAEVRQLLRPLPRSGSPPPHSPKTTALALASLMLEQQKRQLQPPSPQPHNPPAAAVAAAVLLLPIPLPRLPAASAASAPTTRPTAPSGRPLFAQPPPVLR